MAGTHYQDNVENDFRDGAGCFGNNDGVPPSEVREQCSLNITDIIMNILNVNRNVIIKIVSQNFAGFNLGRNSKSKFIKHGGYLP